MCCDHLGDLTYSKYCLGNNRNGLFCFLAGLPSSRLKNIHKIRLLTVQPAFKVLECDRTHLFELKSSYLTHTLYLFATLFSDKKFLI